MTKRLNYRALIFFHAIAIIFISSLSSFADTTKIIYDEVNRVIRVESGGGTAIITAAAGSNGSISPAGALGVRLGDSQAFVITANTNYHIADVKVDGTSIGAVSSYTFTNITSNHTIEAQFAIDTAQLNVSLTDAAGGTVTSAPSGINCGSTCSATYNYGTSVTLTATPNAGYDFAGWWGACGGTENCTLTMDSAKSVTANFSKKAFIISSSGGENGTGGIAPSGAVTVDYGNNQTFTMTPNFGYAVADVLIDGVSAGGVSNYTFSSVTANHTISASFSCSNLPVRIAGGSPQYFTTLQAAYNAAANGDIIQAQALKFSENLSINRNIAVTLEGGYTCDYSTNAGNMTQLKGMIQTFAGGGTLTIKNFTLVANVAAPSTIATPQGGTYNSAQTVTLTCAQGANCDKIYYTTDGTTPAVTSSIYTSPINISQTTVLKYFAVNIAGVREAVQTQTYIIDTAFSAGAITINAGAAATNSTSATLALTCTDSVGCSQMQFSNDNANWTSPEAFAATKVWTLTSGEGTKTVYVKFKDTAGNWSTVYADAIILDTTPPVAIASLPTGSYNTNLSITLSCSDGTGSGCDKIYYTTDGSAPTTASPVYSAPLSITATTALKFFATDLAGNSEAVKTENYNIDTTVPAGTIAINAGAIATNNTAATLTLTCNDANNCTQMQFSSDNASWTMPEAFAATKAWTLSAGDGVKTVYARFKDSIGNWSTTLSDTIILDNVSPSTTATPAGGAYDSAQSITLSCNDGTGGGCDKIYYTTDGSAPTTASSVYSAPLNIAATTTLKYFAKDYAGNSEAVKNQAYAINPVRITATSQNFTSLQAAYDAASDGDVIKIQATGLAGNLNVNRNITVTIEGGYSNDFTIITGVTTLKGMIQTSSGGGTLTIKNFSLTQ